jgi:hypothetical protein
VAQIVRHLLSERKALSSNSSTAKEEKTGAQREAHTSTGHRSPDC